MTGAMYAAVSGLKTHMTALNVIGENVSNCNTYGYKATRYTFNESLYTMNRFGSNGTDVQGGRNPAQIGYGCSIGTIDLDMSSKNYNPTGVGLDCMIDGDGFFIVGDKTKQITTQTELQAVQLSRLGNLEFHDGYLVDGNGSVIYGFPAVSEASANPPSDQASEQDTKIYAKASHILAPLRFPKITYDATFEIEGDYADDTPISENHGRILYPQQTIADGEVPEEGELALEYPANEDELEWPELDSITIDEKSGRITGITKKDDQTVVIGYLAIANVDNPNGVTHVDGRYYQALAGAGGVHVGTIGAAVTTNLTNEALEENGSFNISSAGQTKLRTGGLESSGTELSQEISNMILIQRGYQANTRIVTVTDSMLEELVNMKR